MFVANERPEIFSIFQVCIVLVVEVFAMQTVWSSREVVSKQMINEFNKFLDN